MRDRVVIRAMRPDDVPRVLEIEVESYSTPWPEASFRGLLRRRDAALFVAEAGDELVGYAACWIVLDQGELGNLAVAPRWRRRGIGRRLLDAVIDEMCARAVRELFLEVRVSNTAAQRLYRSRGFREVGRRRHYYNRPVEDALVMRREVVPSAAG
ncbi:MAG TPA: ribosomal protein S18-alanine N-acetyltransferase [Longimicrobiales bacterium]